MLRRKDAKMEQHEQKYVQASRSWQEERARSEQSKAVKLAQLEQQLT